MYYKAKLLYRAFQSTGVGSTDHIAITEALDGIPECAHKPDVAVVVYQVMNGDSYHQAHIVYCTTLSKYEADTQ